MSARLEAAAQVPALKRAKADYELSRPVLPPLESHLSRSAKKLGWGLFYIFALLTGGAIAIVWSLL